MRCLMPTVALGLILCGGASAAAQEPGLAPGARVRVHTYPDGARLVARLLAADADTLRVAPIVDGVPQPALAMPRARVYRLERSTGRHRHVARNAGIGALVGVGAGLLGALTVDEDDLDWFLPTRSQYGLAMGLVVGLPTTTIGALTGLVRTEGWAAVPVPSARTASPDRAGLAVRPRVGTMRVPVRGAPPARAVTVGLTLRPR